MRFASAILNIEALLDSNVVVAALVDTHQHFEFSQALFDEEGPRPFAVAAHSFAEAYSTLTRRSEHAPYRFPPARAWTALESIRAVTSLISLTAPQAFEAIRLYADGGGIGARLYDRLIGEAAVAHHIPTILTWNVAHMRSLFPNLCVETPAEFVAKRP